MLQKNSHFPYWMTVKALYGLLGLAIFVAAALWTNQWVGLPAVLLVMVGWGGMFLLQVVLPILTVIQVLARLNRKLFCRAWWHSDKSTGGAYYKYLAAISRAQPAPIVQKIHNVQEVTMVGVMTGLRLIHILSGVFWAGSAISLICFIEPAVRAAGPAGGTFFEKLWQHTRMLFFMNLSSLLTALTGLVLYWIVSNGNPLAYIGTGIGMGFSLGSAAGLIEFLNGILVMGPTSARIGVLGAQIQTAGGPPTTVQLGEMGTLQKRLDEGGKHGAILLALSVIGMAVARYL